MIPPGEISNVCTGRSTTINELVEIVQKITRRNLETKHSDKREGDVKTKYGDPTKAEEVLGFKAKTDLRSGLKLTSLPFLEERHRESASNYGHSVFREKAMLLESLEPPMLL